MKTKSPQVLFDALAETYETMREVLNWSPFSHVEAALDLASVSGLRVLDVGCGTGEVARLLAAHGAEVVGIDISPEMCYLAAERSENIMFLTHDLSDPLPFPDGRFDILIALGCLEYLPAIAPVLDEFCRVLTQNGLFLGVFERCGEDCPGGIQPQVEFLDDWVRYRQTEEEWHQILAARFEAVQWLRVPGFLLEETGEMTQYCRAIAKGPQVRASRKVV